MNLFCDLQRQLLSLLFEKSAVSGDGSIRVAAQHFAAAPHEYFASAAAGV